MGNNTFNNTFNDKASVAQGDNATANQYINSGKDEEINEKPGADKTISLKGKQIESLRDAIVSAYPSYDKLKELFRFELDERLATIAAPDSLDIVVMKVIEWAEAEGRLEDLIRGAIKRVPRNPNLRQIAIELSLIKNEDRTAIDTKETKPVNSSEIKPATVEYQVKQKYNPDEILKKPAEPIEIFFSYAHEDEALMNKVRSQLVIFERLDKIRKWHDRMIPPGTDWEGQIDDRLSRAKIILLFISTDFIESDYIFDVEMQTALKRHESGEARVIPIILRPCAWQAAPFGRIQALPKDGKPVTQWVDLDAVCLNIAEGIMRVVSELSG